MFSHLLRLAALALFLETGMAKVSPPESDGWAAMPLPRDIAVPAINGNPDPGCSIPNTTVNALSASLCLGPNKPKNADPLCQAATPNPQFCNGQNNPKNVNDLSFITKWAAIGDSYAAGIGAGDRIDYSCSRYNRGYPEVINQDPRLGDPAKRTFINLSCSGDKTPAIIKQANQLPAGQQAITISASGNDADLIGILNDCVYNFYGGFSGSCDGTITNSQNIINSDEFTAAISNTIKAAQAKLSTDGVIYYTGYGKFFDASTNDCDKVSWHFWVNIWSRQYLLQPVRQRLNDLVELANAKIKAACAAAGPNVEFIDWDNYAVMTQGRFCEPGVDENNGWNRDGLLYYQMKTDDPSWGVEPYDPTDEEYEAYYPGLKRRRDPPIPFDEKYPFANKPRPDDNRIRTRTRQTFTRAMTSPNPLLTKSQDAKRDSSPVVNGTHLSPLTILPSNDTQAPVALAIVDALTLTRNQHPDALLNESQIPPESVPWAEQQGLLVASAKHRRHRLRRHRRFSFDPNVDAEGAGEYDDDEDEEADGNENARRGILPNLVPDSWGKAFHPQQAAHQMIANLVTSRMVARQYLNFGIYPPVQDLVQSGVCVRLD